MNFEKFSHKRTLHISVGFVVFVSIIIAKSLIQWHSPAGVAVEPTASVRRFMLAANKKLFDICDEIHATKFSDREIAKQLLAIANRHPEIESASLIVFNSPTMIQTFVLKSGKFAFASVHEYSELQTLPDELLENKTFLRNDSGNLRVCCTFRTRKSVLCFFEYSISQVGINQIFQQTAAVEFAANRLFEADFQDAKKFVARGNRSFCCDAFWSLQNVRATYLAWVALQKFDIELPPQISVLRDFDFSSVESLFPSLVLFQRSDFESIVKNDWAIQNFVWLSITTTIVCIALVVLHLTIVRAAHLEQKQREFISTVTHELKTPIAVVSLTGQNMSRGIVKTNDKIIRYGQTLESEAKRLRDTIDYYLLFASTEKTVSTRKQPCDIVQIVRAATERNFEQRKQADFIYETDFPEIPVITCCDQMSISGMIDNLVGNAAKHARSGKYIKVAMSVENCPRKLSRHKSMHAKTAVFIRVIDKGDGIQESDLKNLFKPFVRGKAASEHQIEGSGIGLNLVKRIAKIHLGDVSVERTGSDGTTFLVILPIFPDMILNK